MSDNPNRKVILEEHNPCWKDNFESEKAKIQSLLNDCKIEHVGSTSVPGLISKPIIDIAIGINSLDDAAKAIALLEDELGYCYDPSKNEKLPGRRHLWKGNFDVHHFHIWIVEYDGNDWKDMVYVRDYLRADEDARKRYGDFKRRILEENIDTICEYRANKRKIYLKILKEAWDK